MIGYDAEVLIVGGGPGGASAALELRKRGLEVAIVDRESFPRYKTCGGGIIGVTRELLPEGAPISSEIYSASFTHEMRRYALRESAKPIMATVDRQAFDDWLLRHAILSGAEFYSEQLVRGIEQAGDHVEIKTDKRIYRAKYVIDASGTSSRIANQLGVELQQIDLGLEVEVEAPSRHEWATHIHLDWGRIPGSYGWLFPKGDRFTVGVIAKKGNAPALKEYLTDFTDYLGLTSATVLHSSGHLTRCRTPNSPLGAGRVLLIGDAAGLLEPWTREGISFATRSGRIAARILADGIEGALSPSQIYQSYQLRIKRELTQEMIAGRKAYLAFERHPGVFHAAMAHTPIGWKYFTRITKGETNFARGMQHFPVALGINWLGRF